MQVKPQMKEESKSVDEGLLDWYGKSESKDKKPGWVNVLTGGTCASDEPGEGVPKCVSSEKRASMSKEERLSASRRKKTADPGQQEKSGAAKPTYVSTDRPKKSMKEEMNLQEVKDKPGKGSGKKDACYNKVKSRYDVWPSAYASGALVKCRKVGADNWGTKSEAANLAQQAAIAIIMKKNGIKPKSKMKEDCWDGYEQKGMKTKGKKMVPNCVPTKGVPKASGYKKVLEQVRPIETQQGKFDRMVGSASLLPPKTKIIMLQQAAKNHPSKVKSVDENHIAISKGKELDDEGGMIKSELETIERAIKLMRSIVKKDNAQVPAWVQSKVTKAADYIDTAADYMAGNDEESVDESFKVIQSSGQLYHIIVNFMSKNYSIKIYFPMQNRPSQQDVNDAVQKIYPGGKTLAYYPCVMSSNSNYLVAKENISFDIPKGSGVLGKRSGEQLLRLKNSGLNNNQLNRELEIRGIKPRGVELPLASRGKGGSPYEPYTGPEKKGPYVPAPQKPSKMQLAHNQIEGDLVESDNHALAARSVEIETEMRKRSKNYLINIGMIGEDKSPAWQRKAGKNPEGGLNDEGIRSYRAQNPGSKLQKAVTTKPSKLKKGSTAAKRRNSFCDRMSGMKEKLTSAKTARDPNSRINKSLRKWNC